jgi:hypothetical protein
VGIGLTVLRTGVIVLGLLGLVTIGVGVGCLVKGGLGNVCKSHPIEGLVR